MDCFRRKQRDYFCCIKLLDETEITQDIQRETRGSVLLDLVYRHLNLLEVDYFGLRYLDSNNQTHWLEPGKAITRQITNGPPYTLYFGVKFYIEDPCQLKEELTCYQFFLQLKQDMLRGRLPCNFSVAAELCGYILQSELGDYDHQKHHNGYVSEFRFIPNQTDELEQQIKDFHISLRGQTPAIAEKNFLERAKWLDMYGVDLHPVRGEDQVDYYLGLTPTGVVVYKGKNKVSVYYWQRVVRVHYREREFVITTKNKESLENEYIFEVEGKAACKHLWKCCVEQHSFFRLPQMMDNQADIQRQTGTARSPKYRQNARTQKEALEISQEINRAPPKVYRARSRRYAPRSAEQNTKSRSPPDGETNSESRKGQTIGGTTVSKAPEPTRTPHQHRRNVQDPNGSTTPWEGNERVGLYTAAGASPVSVRSVNSNHRRRSRSRSPGANSYRRQDTDKSDYSGNESESSRRRRHKHKSGSESEGDNQHHHRHRRRRSSDRMVDSQAQWEYIQQAHQNRGEVRTADDVVIRNLRNGNLPITPTPEQRMWRRARSHSGDRRASKELKKHIEYELVDTEQDGDPYDIPYKNIVTTGVAVRVSKSPLQPRKRSRSRDRKRLSQSSIEGDKQYEEDEDKFITLSIQQPTPVQQARHNSGYEPPYSSPTHKPRQQNNGPPPPYTQASPSREKHRNGEIRVVSGPVRPSGENGGRVPDVANVGERGMFARQQEEKIKRMSRNGKDQDAGSGYYSASVYRVDMSDTPSPNPYLLLHSSFCSYASSFFKTKEDDGYKFSSQRHRRDSGIESDYIYQSDSVECQFKESVSDYECEDSLAVRLDNTLRIQNSSNQRNIKHPQVGSEFKSGHNLMAESFGEISEYPSLHLDSSKIKLEDLKSCMAELLRPVTSGLGQRSNRNSFEQNAYLSQDEMHGSGIQYMPNGSELLVSSSPGVIEHCGDQDVNDATYSTTEQLYVHSIREPYENMNLEIQPNQYSICEYNPNLEAINSSTISYSSQEDLMSIYGNSVKDEHSSGRNESS
ncbi:band 4.1-like protein 4 isoform X2 [Antedon mediterranea]|uniref:band 4.1-like protein 4 isoform X2 n=1 Tax=Antedon mediterranea TaxID=105859 RepID=UPI003AF97445